MNRVEEIQKRMAEIDIEIQKRGDSIKSEDLTAFADEVDKLVNEKAQIEADVTKRNKVLGDIATGVAKSDVISERKFPGTMSRKAAAGITGDCGEAGDCGDADADADDVYSSIAYRKSFQRFATLGKDIPAEYRANATTKTSDAEVMVPNTVINRIYEKINSSGNILPLVTRTSYTGGVQVPKSSAKPTAKWVAEGKGSDKQKKSVDYIVFRWNKLRCAVAMTLEMATMSLAVFEQTLVDNIIEAMTIALEEAIISGDGEGKPKGILSEKADNAQIVRLTGNKITLNTLANAEAALPAAYDGKAEYCMSKAALVQCMTIVDNNKQLIFRNVADSTGKLIPTIFGRKVNVTDYVPKLGADTPADTCVAFMLYFKDYLLNMNKQITMKKYTDEDTDDEVMKAVALADGQCIVTDSLVKIMTESAKS